MRVVLKPGGLALVVIAIVALAGIALTKQHLQTASAAGGAFPAGKAAGPLGVAPKSGKELPVRDDAYVAGAEFAGETRNSLTYILIKTPPSRNERRLRVGYAKVPLDSLGSPSVKEARLVFYVSRLSGPQGAAFKQGDTVELSLLGLADNKWTADHLTYNTQPSKKDAVPVATVSVTGLGWYSVDVTDFVNHRLQADHTASFRISDEKGADTIVRINGTRSEKNQPYMTVTL